MNRKKIYPIGYLLKVLHISYTDLANALYLERTVVNKWALGKRSFNSRSKHYNKVVDYLIQVNLEKKEFALENFFERIYPNMPKSDTYLRDCINRFLGESEFVANVGGAIISTKENVIYCSVPVVQGSFGRFASLLDLLDKTLLTDKKYEISLYDNEQFKWLTSDEYYNIRFQETMIKVLEQGHSVTFISDIDYLKRHHEFSEVMDLFYPYPNFNEYFFFSGNNPEMFYSYYFVKGHRVVIGNRLSNDELYTITFSDPYSVDSCGMRLKNHLRGCVLHKMVKNDDERMELIDLIKKIERTGDTCFIFAIGLAFITMSQELLSDILQTNKIYGEKKEIILSLLQNHENYVYDKYVSETSFRQLCYYNDIEKMLKKDKWYLEDLSLHLGKKIYMNHSQIKRHIYDTADLLEKKKNYSLGFVRENNTNNRTQCSHLCRRNQYAITCRGQLRITREVSIINTISDIFENEWQNNIPLEYKDNVLVAGRLRELVKKYDK